MGATMGGGAITGAGAITGGGIGAGSISRGAAEIMEEDAHGDEIPAGAPDGTAVPRV
jgi:hypothetical protein